MFEGASLGVALPETPVRAIATVTGAIGVEDVLDEIFSRFCLGK